ncbi:hypothetical protein BW143_19145 [Bacillus swezeyi]|uniref:Uncharacterized protein n=1 Tax=Bacillus swezeyi TaxID=1925020 RepID=A0A1R1QBM4_9BACI|nr:hypothetical protein BW143_19145 [Bacillus swezeyi]
MMIKEATNFVETKEKRMIRRSFSQIVDKILKQFKVLGFCHPFSVIENLCSLGSIGAERMLQFVSTDAQA